MASPARAQLSGSITLASDDRLRGRTLSSGRPASTLSLAYDDSSGFYVEGATTVSSTRGGDIALTGGAIDAGYVWRTVNDLAIDIGATRRQFTRYFSGGRVKGYTEVYAGLSLKDWAARVSFSPDYFAPKSHTLYLSLDRTIRLSGTWRLTAHAGTTAYLSPPRVNGLRPVEYDYAVGIAHRWDLFEVRLAFSSGGPDPDFYNQRPHKKTGLALSGSFAF